jgi:hypothetical protein
MQQFDSDKNKHDVLKARLRLRIRQIRRIQEAKLESAAQSKPAKA